MPDVVRPLEPDLPAGQALDPEDEPVECRADSQIVEDRQAQVAADGTKAIGDGPGDIGAFGVAGGIEAANEQRQLLERIVVDVGRQTSPLRFRGQRRSSRAGGWRGSPGERGGGP